MIGLNLPEGETMTRAEYRDTLENPLLAFLQEKGLLAYPAPLSDALTNSLKHSQCKVRYAVLCFGVPLRIAEDASMYKPGDEQRSEAMRRNGAAVDSELCLLPWRDPNRQFGGPSSNPWYATANSTQLSPCNGLLMVTRLDGPSALVARQLVDKAMEAETNGLWGRAYFDLRAEPTNSSYYLGDVWMRTGAKICSELGFDVEMDTNAETFPASFPMSQIAIYAGWYDSDVSGPFTLPHVEFMPGAFAYHLHSYSADTIRSATERWCGPLLAKGATCTMGCVYEPYLQFTPNIAFFLQALGNGYTFGEAAWASQVALSWQTTVIGDPLYQPFNKPPAELHAELTRKQSPLIEWSFERLINRDLLQGVPELKLEKILEEMPATTTSPVLMEKLADFYDSLGKPASAIIAWQNALKLGPSPQQRIRIRRTLGEKLAAQGRKTDAVNDYKELLAEAPDYPGKSQIEEDIKALEQADADTNAPAK